MYLAYIGSRKHVRLIINDYKLAQGAQLLARLHLIPSKFFSTLPREPDSNCASGKCVDWYRPVFFISATLIYRLIENLSVFYILPRVSGSPSAHVKLFPFWDACEP